MKQFDYRSALREVLMVKQKENPQYSGRAFARDLGISVTALHGVLNQTRHLSKSNLEQIAKSLGWSESQLNLALESTKFSSDPTQSLLEDDEFQLIADWVHLAILNLAKIKNISCNTIAERLGVDEEVSQETIERLIRLNYIEIDENNCLKRLTQSFGVSSKDIPSQSIQSFHHSNLAKAQNALMQIPLSERNFLTIAAPTNIQKMDELRKLIEEFRKQALSLFECEEANQVYFLNLQLYPVTKVWTNS